MGTNTQGMAVSFKQDLLNAYHNFGTSPRTPTTADSFKGALFCVNQGMGLSSTTYGANNQTTTGITFTATATTIAVGTALALTATTSGYPVVGMQLWAAAGITAGTYVTSIAGWNYATQTGTLTVSAAMTASSGLVYSTGEVTNGAGTGYTQGGTILTNATAPVAGTTGTTINTSTASTMAIGSSTITVSAGTGATMPPNGTMITGTGIPSGTFVVSTSGAWPATATIVVNSSQGSTALTTTNVLSYYPPTAFWTPSAQVQWTAFTSSGPFDTLAIYNSTQAGSHVVSVHTFGTQNVSAGTFTLTMPTNAAATALLNLS
jgi:hypothetical protein